MVEFNSLSKDQKKLFNITIGEYQGKHNSYPTITKQINVIEWIVRNYDPNYPKVYPILDKEIGKEIILEQILEY
jgi:hypothetical protein